MKGSRAPGVAPGGGAGGRRASGVRRAVRQRATDGGAHPGLRRFSGASYRGKPPRDTNGLVDAIKIDTSYRPPHLERPAPEDHAATYCLPEMSSTNVEKPTEPEGVQITTGTQCPKFFPSQNSAPPTCAARLFGRWETATARCVSPCDRLWVTTRIRARHLPSCFSPRVEKCRPERAAYQPEACAKGDYVIKNPKSFGGKTARHDYGLVRRRRSTSGTSRTRSSTRTRATRSRAATSGRRSRTCSWASPCGSCGR